MHFSFAPRALDVHVFASPQWCVGDCETHYSVTDVYFAEVCVLSFVCRNRDKLFRLGVGELFECDLDRGRWRELRTLLANEERVVL